MRFYGFSLRKHSFSFSPARPQAVIQERSLVLDFITQAGTSLLATPSKYSPSKAAETGGGARMPPADPLSPYTPEAAAAAAEAEQNIKVSKVGVVV